MTTKFSTEPRYRYYTADHAHRYARHVAQRDQAQMEKAGDTLHGINWRPRPVPSPRPAGQDRIKILREWREASRLGEVYAEKYGAFLQEVVSPVDLP